MSSKIADPLKRTSAIPSHSGKRVSSTEYISIRDVCLAWVKKRLAASRKSTADSEIVDEALEQVRIDLQGGKLTAYVHLMKEWEYKEIHSHFWANEFSIMSLDGTLIDLDDDRSFPRRYANSPVELKISAAVSWLKSKNVGSRSPHFPGSLKDFDTNAARNSYRPSPVRKALVDEAVRFLEDGQGITPEFKRSHLVRYLSEYSQKLWASEPSERTMKNYVNEAVAIVESKRASRAKRANLPKRSD